MYLNIGASAGLKLKVILKWKDIYIENIGVVLLMASLKIEGTVKWRGLKSQRTLYVRLQERWSDHADSSGLLRQVSL